MKFIIIQTIIIGIVLLYQTTTSTFAEYGYIVGWAGLVITLLGGFAHVVSKITKLQAAVDVQGAEFIKLEKKFQTMCDNNEKMADKVQTIKESVIRLEK